MYNGYGYEMTFDGAGSQSFISGFARNAVIIVPQFILITTKVASQNKVKDLLIKIYNLCGTTERQFSVSFTETKAQVGLMITYICLLMGKNSLSLGPIIIININNNINLVQEAHLRNFDYV